MIKIKPLKFDIGESVDVRGNPAVITGYINYNSQFRYIVVYDGKDQGEECGEDGIRKRSIA